MPRNIESVSSSEEKEPLSKERVEEIQKLWDAWDKKHQGENTLRPEEIAREMSIDVEEFHQFMEQTGEENDKWYEKYLEMKGLTKE